MNEREFRDVMDTCLDKSGNDLKDYLAQFSDQPIVVSLLTGTEFDDIGIARTSARSVAEKVFDGFEDSEGTLTESIAAAHAPHTPGIDGHDIDQLYMDLEMLDSKSGDDQKAFLEEMFEDYAYPSVVSYAVLSDQSLGFGESTLAKAFDVKDSLPFYESVVDILRDDEPLTQPAVGKAFKPMKAVPESRGQPDNPMAQRKIDGYRLLLHIADSEDATAVRAFTRRMNDVTESLPELQEIDWPQGDYIVDCEVIAENGSYSDTSSRIGRSAENVERDLDMEFAFFDLLVNDGTHIHDNPYTQRYLDLMQFEASIDSDKTYVLGVTDDIEKAKDEAMANEEEGIIVKDTKAPYEFDKRSAYWQKQKFDAETVDVRVVSVLEGEKKNTGTMGKLAIESSDGVSLGKTGSGFTDAERDEIWANQDEWVGRIIEVEARGFDDNLRMPIYKRDRTDDGAPDSIDRIEEVMMDV